MAERCDWQTGAPIPDHLRDEPRRAAAGTLGLTVRVILRHLALPLLAPLSLPIWLLFLVAARFWGWPPHLATPRRFWRYRRLVWHAPLPLLRRLYVLQTLAFRAMGLPWWGLAWIADEVLYGRLLDAHPVRAPLLHISAGRSGSTQLARYLEDDPALVAPSLLQFLFPYRWLWRLTRATVGRWITPDRVRAWVHRALPAEMAERHELDPFRTDTFDGGFAFNRLVDLAGHLGPDAFAEEFGRFDEAFVSFLGRVGSKVLVDAPGARLFVKGHFVDAAPALARAHPDARFFTMLRHPIPRLRSAINYLRANPSDPVLGPVPWATLGEGVVRAEIRYCRDEMAFYEAKAPGRHVIRFEAYREDLTQTIAELYRACLDRDPPASAPTEHPPRRRQDYRLDRSLPEVGVDPARVAEELADYIAWCGHDGGRPGTQTAGPRGPAQAHPRGSDHLLRGAGARGEHR